LTASTWPEMLRAAGLQRKAAAAEMSSAVAIRLSGAVNGVLPLAEVINDCAYGIVFGFDSVWVRQHDRVVRIQP